MIRLKKNKVKKEQTQPIDLKNVTLMLNFLENKMKIANLSAKFMLARNRISIYIIFFTRIRVGSLLDVSFYDIQTIL